MKIKMKLIIFILLFAFPVCAFATTSVEWQWRHDARCTSGYDKCSDAPSGIPYSHELWGNPASLHYSYTTKPTIYFHLIDTSNADRAYEFLYWESVDGGAYAATPVLDAWSRAVPTVTTPFGDTSFYPTKDSASGSGGSALGKYGRETAYKWRIGNWDTSLTTIGSVLSSGGSTTIPVDIADGSLATVAFYLPKFFYCQYPDTYNSTTQTGDKYNTVEKLTSSSADIVIISPYVFSGANPYIKVAYGTTASLGSEVSAAPPIEGRNILSITGLAANTTYYYRLKWRNPGVVGYDGEYLGEIKTFKTLATATTTDCSFIINADGHYSLDSTSTTFNIENRAHQTLQKSGADFIIDLGDSYGTDLGANYFQEQFNANMLRIREAYQTINLPIGFLVPGNHEAINSYYSTTADISEDNNLSNPGHKAPWWAPSYAGYSRNNFFSINGQGDYKTYGSLEHGDALFIFLDPFLYTTVYPITCDEDYAATYPNNYCTYTLGAAQTTYLRNLLASTTKTWKFIFMHQNLGGESGTKGCYGRSGLSTMYRCANNKTEILDSIIDKEHTVMFFGHDHIASLGTYEGILNVMCGSMGGWGAYLCWLPYSTPLGDSIIYHEGGNFMNGTSYEMQNVPEPTFRARITSVEVPQSYYAKINYEKISGYDDPFTYFLGRALNETTSVQSTAGRGICIAGSVTAGTVCNEDSECGTSGNCALSVAGQSLMIQIANSDVTGWRPNDIITLPVNGFNYMGVSYDDATLRIQAFDINGMPIRKTLVTKTK